MSFSVPVVRTLIFFATLAVLLGLEQFTPCQSHRIEKINSWLINIGLGLLNAILTTIVCATCLGQFSQWSYRNGAGLFAHVSLGYWGELGIVIVAFDCLSYFWHRANHSIPFLWRFHKVHHTDLSLDATTASRFHVGEIFLSILIRVPLVVLLAPRTSEIIIFETLFMATTQFEHANLNLGGNAERILSLLFITPKIHRFHHSQTPSEFNSNYGTIFSPWDRLAKTLTFKAGAEKIKIGQSNYSDPSKLKFFNLLRLPFTA